MPETPRQTDLFRFGLFELDGRTGKCLDAVQAARMQQDLARPWVAEPGDVYRQRFAAGAGGIECERMQDGARGLRRGAKARTRRDVVRGKKFRRVFQPCYELVS